MQDIPQIVFQVEGVRDPVAVLRELVIKAGHTPDEDSFSQWSEYVNGPFVLKSFDDLYRVLSENGCEIDWENKVCYAPK